MPRTRPSDRRARGGSVASKLGKSLGILRLGLGLLLAAALAGCGGEDPKAEYGLPSTDVILDVKYSADSSGAGKDAIQDLASDAQAQDMSGQFDQADAQEAVDAEPGDAEPANTPPQFQPLKALTLAQGQSTTIDVNPLLYDAEDLKSALKLSWSAKQVGLKDPGSHVIYVVAPTTWFGTETVDLTVKDLGGLTAVQPLQITVTEVQAPPPQRTQDCGQTEFSIAAGTAAKQVLLSGSFNGWASTADKADVLSDPKGTGTWTVQKKLAAGVYQYKFIVDGKWLADKANPNQTSDGFGGMNSVIEVKPCAP